ncbi:MAG: hypothetical protein MJK18_01010 [Bdellovibrionales bacterium]|nr:hypothetical protein [Bdellovibrionales bacterium]
MKLLISLLITGLGFQAYAYKTEKVEFKSHGTKMVGTLFLPDNYKKRGPASSRGCHRGLDYTQRADAKNICH